MSLKHGLLGLLHYGNKTGYQLNTTFEESLGFFWKAQTSQIYRELKTMEKNGWLTSQVVVQWDKPNKRVYEITATGQEEFKNWLTNEPLSCTFNNRSALIMKIFFSGINDIEFNIEKLREFITDCGSTLKELEKADKIIACHKRDLNMFESPLFWSAAADFGKMQVAMCRNWAEKTIETLEKEKLKNFKQI